MAGKNTVSLDLLPLQLTPAYLQAWLQRITAAKHCPPSFATLSIEERERFESNCAIIKRARAALILRNLALYEIYVARQWREDYQNIEDFARNHAEMSKGNLYKCIDDARVIYVFSAAGWKGLKPSGHYTGLIVKVAEEHWLAAWSFALEWCVTTSFSESNVRDALRDYCRDHRIDFGRRRPNGLSEGGLGTSFLLPETTSKTERPAPKLERNLTPEIAKVFIGAISADTIQEIESAFAHKSAESVILNAIRSHLPLPNLTEEEKDNLGAFLEVLREDYPEEYGSFVLLGLANCREVLRQTVRKLCRKNSAGRADYQKKKATPNPSA